MRGGETPRVKLYPGDCREVLADMDADSVHLAVTDPPYFLDRLDGDWNQAQIDSSKRHADVVGGLPIGMKFDPEQGRRLQEFLTPIAKEALRVLKPGAFCATPTRRASGLGRRTSAAAPESIGTRAL